MSENRYKGDKAIPVSTKTIKDFLFVFSLKVSALNQLRGARSKAFAKVHYCNPWQRY